MDKLFITLDKPEQLTVVEGPTYEQWSEDGGFHRFDYFVVYTPEGAPGPKSKSLTLNLEFLSKFSAEEARDAFRDCGGFHALHWDAGDPWQGYHQDMSLEERWAPYGPAWQAEQEGR